MSYNFFLKNTQGAPGNPHINITASKATNFTCRDDIFLFLINERQVIT